MTLRWEVHLWADRKPTQQGEVNRHHVALRNPRETQHNLRSPPAPRVEHTGDNTVTYALHDPHEEMNPVVKDGVKSLPEKGHHSSTVLKSRATSYRPVDTRLKGNPV
ncbi:hypothetical protein RRG08_013538 [Elysia crispata]|uniref:Uncharacterized protein n=1 Tax=Elysia crispata TaxID=231223 RepID=A0AAE0Y150_9GAST|nr:hypothetical protein RRG08_013538 [Elysia crispata]